MRGALLACTLLAAALPAAAQPVAIQAQGAWTHAPSGMVFPEHVGPFRRIAIYRYDQQGLDVGANYHLGDPAQAIASFYVYPAPRTASCTGEFNARKQELEQAREGARLVREEEEAAPGRAAKMRGRVAAYLFRADFFGKPQPVLSELHLFCHVAGRWFVKYRLSAPEAQAPAAFRAFMNTLPWTLN